MIIVVTGGRHYSDHEQVAHTLDAVVSQLIANGAKDVSVHVWHGGANGSDTLAHRHALQREWTSATFRANWRLSGKAAGPMRNESMIQAAATHLRAGQTVRCVAFPGGRGTADCVARARAHNIPVIEVTP